VAAAIDTALSVLEDVGATLHEVSLPSAGDLAAVGSLLSMWEAFTLHAGHLRQEAAAYGPKARANIASGGFYGSDEVGQALQLRVLWMREVAAAFKQVDALVTPTLPAPAVTRDDWVARPPDTSWATRAFSLTGHPALTLPCGFAADGMPIGLQVAARHFDERTMFRVAHCFERATPWHERRPDPAWWSDPLPSTSAVAKVAALADDERHGWRLKADRLGLPFTDGDLDRVAGIVTRVRRGLEDLRFERTSEIEPPRFAIGES
jgi:aspartyl-tRNA(Asn)/glutamyl-tRNA(Gln) amidotransferase subunit A